MKSNVTVKRLIIALSLVLTLSAGYYVGTARAADAKFDLAIDNIVKASALLNASEVPNPKCEKYRLKAIRYLEKAQERIDRAKACIDGV